MSAAANERRVQQVSQAVIDIAIIADHAYDIIFGLTKQSQHLRNVNNMISCRHPFNFILQERMH